MKNKIKVLSLIFCTIFLATSLTSCGVKENKNNDVKNENKIVDLDQKQKKSDKETVMVYMVASNLESEAALASTDIVEMVESKFDKKNMDVLVCAGGTQKWWIKDIPNDKCTVYKVSDSNIEPVYTMKGKNMGESDTLTEFLDYGYENYKADCYGLVLWDHGAGAVVGYGADENYNYDSLSMSELDSSLSSSKIIKDKNKFEWIGFDACLMGMIEVADTLKPYSNYMIASEEVESGEGWDYTFLKDMSQNKKFDGAETGKVIIDSYSKYFESGKQPYKPDYVLSCFDLSETESVINSLEEFVNVAEKELKNGGYSKIARVRDTTKSFGRDGSKSFYDTVDIYDLAEKMQGMYSSESAKLKESVGKLVVYNKSNMPEAKGVSIYFPYENKEYSDQWLKEYSKFKFSDTYASFIKNFSNTLSGEVLAEWDVEETAPVQETESTANSGSYYVELTDNQAKNFAHASAQIWQEDKQDSYICYVSAADVKLSDDGKLRTKFDGKKFYIGDTSGHSSLCSAIEVEHGDDYSKYMAPVMITHIKDLKTEIAYVQFKVDKDHPNGYIVGVYKSLDTDSNLFPDKNMVKIEEGDDVRPYFFARNIKFNGDGSLAPFNEWKSTSGAGSSFEFSGSLTIDSQIPEGNQEYCCVFLITDTQGNQYSSNPIYIKK